MGILIFCFGIGRLKNILVRIEPINKIARMLRLKLTGMCNPIQAMPKGKVEGATIILKDIQASIPAKLHSIAQKLSEID